MNEANRSQGEMSDEEAAEVGRAFMERLYREEPGYCWSESPAEVLTDLINQRDEARADAARYQFLCRAIDFSHDAPGAALIEIGDDTMESGAQMDAAIDAVMGESNEQR